MNKQSVAFEINGGSNNELSDSNIAVKNGGKGVVLNETHSNKFKNLNIILDEEKVYFENLKSVIENIEIDESNRAQNLSYQTNSLNKINEILISKNKTDFVEKISQLTSIFSGWIAINQFLFPIFVPIFNDLLKYAGGA